MSVDVRIVGVALCFRVMMRHSGEAGLSCREAAPCRSRTMGTDKQSHVKPRSAKKPYQKPSFKHEKVFETMALACGKIQPTQGSCKAIKKNS